MSIFIINVLYIIKVTPVNISEKLFWINEFDIYKLFTKPIARNPPISLFLLLEASNPLINTLSI